MKISKAEKQRLEGKIQQRFTDGDEILVIGNIALSGTRMLTEQKKGELKERFSDSFLNQIPRLWSAAEEEYEKALHILKEEECSIAYEIGEGGILTALWECAEVSQVGLSIHCRSIPVRQETIEICDLFDLNPYQLHSEKCMIAGTTAGASLAMKLAREGICAALIGNTNRSSQRLLYNGQNIGYLRRPDPDPIRKVLEL